MARPVNADAQATQAKILSTAYELFASRGIDGASIRDIAKGAGVSLAMVHHYFGSKQGLYEACITTMIRELGGLWSGVLSMMGTAEMTPAKLIAHAIREGYRFARDHRTAVRLFQRSLVDTGELDARVREDNVTPFLATASKVLGELLNQPAHTLRLPIQSVVFLVVRYSITSDTDLALLVGARPAEETNDDYNDIEAAPASSEGSIADRAVEAHLVSMGLRILGLALPA